MRLLLICLAIGLLPGLAVGEGTQSLGADILMNSVSPSQSKPAVTMGYGNIKLDDPFLVHFFTTWQTASKLSFHTNLWARMVLEKEYEKAAHLWSTLQDNLPPSFETTARVAYVSLLWRMGLTQVFWNRWFEMVSAKELRESKAFAALNLSIHAVFAQRFAQAHVQMTPDQARFFLEEFVDPNPIYDTIRASSLLRAITGRTTLAQNILIRLDQNNPYFVPLSKSLSLAYARSGDLGAAGKALKGIEARVLASGDEEAIASYQLQIARLLYQSGNLDAAGVFYRKIPRGSKDFLTAREELTWVLLQKGDFGHLRGELETFRMDVWKERFLPEVHLVSAIGNLKLCFFSQVKKDFEGFLKKNRSWATRIELQEKKGSPARPEVRDYYVIQAEDRFAQIKKEIITLNQLAEESKTAALPAVGIQPHWLRAATEMQHLLELAEKSRDEEYRRVWKGKALALRESIRKMRFVKVELLSQLSRLADRVGKPKLKGNHKTTLVASNSSLTFPFDGIIWPDEVFNLQSVTEGQCL